MKRKKPPYGRRQKKEKPMKNQSLNRLLDNFLNINISESKNVHPSTFRKNGQLSYKKENRTCQNTTHPRVCGFRLKIYMKKYRRNK